MTRSYRFGPFIFDRSLNCLTRSGKDVLLTKRQFHTLGVLLDAGGDVVGPEVFFEKVWVGTSVEKSSLTQTIFMLRRILGRLPNGESYIETVPKQGYRISKGATAQVLVMPSPSGQNRKEFNWYLPGSAILVGWCQIITSFVWRLIM
ncbi:hypothetical protein FTW19_12320 [Terriglobus albidus]|uniref:OmpR/PhoB-type domain-containing protein n=1 Tax=Terriglobus albidus TaxID=1592106 RepID=A0A5B9EC74_9BACT|nr:winged helix-turn-helix domain-containing protein [Terriglobus albidus]QEE28715.1 hypothetical protein FTW19_12320 [Terriglobus albidus]